MAANTRSQRRKREAATGSTSTPSTKLSGPGVCWEWEGDGSVWTPFASDHNNAITDAFLNGQQYIDRQVFPGNKLRITFASMVQTNCKTGWQRDIRCISQSSTYEYSDVWQWMDSNNTWELYPGATARLLEAAQVLGKPTVNISLQGKSYNVDLIGMIQKPYDHATSQPIRRLTNDDVPRWEWQNEYGMWIEYPRSLVHQFEAARDGGSAECPFSIAGRSYYLRLDRMEQENKSTKVTRSVRRIAPTTPTTSKLVKQESSGSVPSGSVPSGSGSSMDTTPGPSTTQITTAKTVSVKAVVDRHCTPKANKVHVYEEDDAVWDAMLNQTNYRNNNNKFYIIQLLEDNTSKSYSVWMRWGRVGLVGQSKLETFGSDLDRAKDAFEKKFMDKTRNLWSDRENFVKQEGKYDLLRMDYTTKVEEDEEEEQVDTAEVVMPVCKLDPRLQSLIELICDVKTMEEAVVEMKYDAQKAPLGKLTTDQIKAGYITLKKIEDCIQSGEFGEELVKACDEFYTRIPHSFGMQRPPLIRTTSDVQQKLQLLQALGDIEIAMKVLSRKRNVSEHPLDQHYRGLQCALQPLDHTNDDFKMVETYIRQTHGKTHSQYRLSVINVYTVDKETEKLKFQDIGNRMLLWHGSRLSNWVGILSQGLRIAPPEAPVTGYMFGKGVYFADMCSKSANYCFASKKKRDGILLLCDVSLGKTNNLLAADYNADQLPGGKHSTKGLGRVEPDPAGNMVIADNCVVPCGPGVDTGVSNPHGYTLQYNEYIVYNTDQIKMKYLVHVNFTFK